MAIMYCGMEDAWNDHRVSIYVPGAEDDNDDNEEEDKKPILDYFCPLSIVMRDTLRLRISPMRETTVYQEIGYVSSEQMSPTPPPLPPRWRREVGGLLAREERRRKNLFYHLGLGDTLSDEEKMLVMRNMNFDIQNQVKQNKKNLSKYLGLNDVEGMDTWLYGPAL